MKKQLLCWGLAAWLTLWQVSPALAAGSVSGHTEADSAEEEETNDADAAVTSAPVAVWALAPDAALIAPPASADMAPPPPPPPAMASPPAPSAMPSPPASDVMTSLLAPGTPPPPPPAPPGAAPAMSGSTPAFADIALPPAGYAPSGASALPNVSEPLDYATPIPADKPAPDAPHTVLSSGAVRIDQALGGAPSSGPVVIDQSFGGNTYAPSSVYRDPPPEPESPPPPPFTFTDVPSTHYAYAPVSWAVEYGITNGTSATTFSPNNLCTHWQILTFLWRLCIGSEDKLSVSEERALVALWAKENGLIPNDEGEFKGGETCSRADAMRYIWIFCGCPTPSQRSDLTDLPSTEDYALAISWAVEMEIASGYSDKTFRPDNSCTRAHIVKFLYLSYTVGALARYEKVV